MIYTIYPPQSINGNVKLPASKSISNRVLLLNALSGEPQPITNLSDSDDTQVLKSALESNETLIDIGAAGTAMRFLTAYLAQLPGEYILTGSERMKNRPVGILVQALKDIGADIDYAEKEGYPPLKIKGRSLEGGSVRLPGNVSSQYISALMMIAPRTNKGIIITLEGEIISEPYIRMTESLMKQFGVKVDREDNTLRIEPQAYTSIPFTVESDWSAASYMYEIMALAPDAEIIMDGLLENSLQGDAKAEKLFRCLEYSPNGFFGDLVETPDLAQGFAVACCLLDIPFHFVGLQSLRIKETDRIHAMQEEMKKLGFLLTSESDGVLNWTGARCPAEDNPVIATYQDHRMAMAFAPVALKTGVIRIADPEVVTKSYPCFWEDLKRLGFRVEN